MPAPLAFLIALLISTLSLAQSPQVVREIFVPLDDLNVVLESETQRVFLTRKEYDELLAKAKTTAEKLAPIASAITSASYQARLEPGRAVIEGKITLEILHDGLQIIPLQLSGVGVRSAMLDDRPAILARDPQRGPLLVLEGRGKHVLTLTLTTPLATSAAQQTLQVELPHAPAAQLSLTVPGNVEVKSGAAVIRRDVDAEANVTTLELALGRGPLSVVLSLNNKLLAKDLVALARSVYVDEMTQAYERLHATVSLVVLHGALESAQIELPKGFEVTSVSSPLVSRWAVADGVLDIALRESATDTVVFNISAVRNGPPPDDWRFPQLVVKNVESQAAVIGLLLEDRLQARSIAATSLVAIDTSILTASIPPAVLEAGPGLPAIRPVVAYYAPHEAFSLAAAFDRPQGELLVTSSVLVTVSEESHKAEVGLSLVPRAERLFQLEVIVPAAWQVTAARRSDGQPLVVERYAQDDGSTRLRLTLPGGAPMNVATDVILEATAVPTGWLDLWQEKTFTFPVFKVPAADRTDGAIAIAVGEDLQVRPEKIAGLLPLTEAERVQFQLGRGAAALAYRHDGPLPDATFTAVRRQPSMVAEVYNFHRLTPGALDAHYELNYDIREASARELSFSLPVDTPEQVSIRGLAGVTVKDTRWEVVDGRRIWRVQLDQRRRGIVKLAVDLQMRLAAQEPKGLVLPQAKAEGVDYQTGLVAVEGHAELDVLVAKHPRKVDEGELYAAEYQVGTRLVGAFGYLGEGSVSVDVVRHGAYGLPTALSRQTRLVTQVGIAGISQTEAIFTLRTKAAFLEIELPPSAELWTITLDGQATKPQKNQGRLLLSLPSTIDQRDREVKIVFQQPTDKISLAGSVELIAPRLLVREAAKDEAVEAPSADARWTLVLPTGYEARRSFGSVDVTIPPREPAAWKFLKSLAAWGYRSRWSASGMLYDRSESMTKAAIEASPQPMAVETWDAPATPPMAQQPSAPLSEADDSTFELRFGANREDAARLAQPKARMPMTQPAIEPAPAAIPTPNGAKGDVRGKGQGLEGRPEPKPAAAMKALEGVAGLIIGVQTEQCSPQLLLDSLGDSPLAGVTLIRREPLIALAWAVGLAIFGYGMLRARSSPLERTSYVGGVLVAATVVPLVLPWFDVWGEVADGAFFGAGFTGIVYVLMALGSTMSHATRRVRESWLPRIARLLGATAVLLIALNLMSARTASAQAPVSLDKIVPLLVEDLRPVKVPDDAVIVPFDASDPEGIAKATKVLVPYATYLSLWNQANPDKKLAGPEPQLPYGVGAARYETQLGSDDSLDMRGALEIEVFTDKPVSIPLGLSGGVLLSAKLDGAAARLQIVQPEEQLVGQGARKAMPHAAEPVVLLYVSGKGRKKLEITYRFKLERQGGWRVARGALPAVGGAGLIIAAPNDPAEIRLAGVVDRDSFETAKAGETVETALDPAGRFTLSWRPKVAENMVDRGVAVQSQGVFDVRQDVLRLTWRMNFEFPRSRRDRLAIETPVGYKVERIVGENVRSWETKPAEGRNSEVEITLLKEAVDRESITVYLARYGAVGHGEMATISVPIIAAAGAPLQQGTITLRRDPLLDVRITNTLGASREDVSLDGALAQAADAYDVGPIPVRVFQAYRFASLPAMIGLSISPLPVKTEAEVQAILNVSERTTSLEAKVIVTPAELPVHRVDIVLPSGLVDEAINAIVPEGFEKSIVDKNGRRILTIHTRQGQQRPFSITIVGKLTRGEDKAVVSVPRFEVLNVARQQGTMVIQADPAYDVSVQNEAGCETVPVPSTFPWLQEQKRANARAAIRWRSPEYAAKVALQPKDPVIASRLFHNVRITPRTLEQTIVAEFQVSGAGIREVTLLLPKQLQAARVTARSARRTVIEANADLPAGFVRLRVELEDELIGRYQLLLSHDRLISAQKQTIQIPALEAGSPQRRFLSIESAGRDEVIVDDTVGLDSLTRGQQAYAELVGVLGGDNFAQAYTATSTSAGPAITLSLKERETVETAAARIGLAETLLVLDRAGAYRARQVYRVDNSSEQFLEVELPSEAQLWTVTVDNQPAKPVVGSRKEINTVRIPIIRRSRGDADYEVALIYAGRLERLSWLGKVTFPFPRSVNINVERSVVRLMAPHSHSWFGFDGSLGLPVDEVGVQRTTQAYFKRQLGLTIEVLKSGDKFASARAENNLKQLGIALHSARSYNSAEYSNSQELASDWAQNARELEEGFKQAQQQVQESTVVQGDNRERLQHFFSEQEVQRAKNVVGNDVRNFDEQRELRESQSKAAGGKELFSKKWLEGNQLAQNNEAAKPSSRYVEEGKKGIKDVEDGEAKGQQRPRFNRGQQEKSVEGAQQDYAQSSAGLDAQRDQALGNYRSRLAQQTEQQQQLAAPNASAYGDQSGSGQLRGGGFGGAGGRPGFAAPPGADPSADIDTVTARSDMPDDVLAGERGAARAPGGGMPGRDLGLASLNLEIQPRGTEYRFVTARGDLEITARYVDTAWLQRIGLLLASLVAIASVLFAARSIDWTVENRRLRWLWPVLLIVPGLILLIVTNYPRWGLVLLALGGLLLIRAWLLRRE